MATLQFPPLPTPIAPARPISNTIPVSMGGVSGNLDQFGNILNAAGQQIGVVPNSVADVGTAGAPTPPTAPQSGILGWLNKGMNALDSVTGAPNADNPSGGQKSVLGIHLQDLVVIIVGIILIAAGLFSFKQTQTIIQTGGKIGKRVAEVASA